jgi:hypothetical protein
VTPELEQAVINLLDAIRFGIVAFLVFMFLVAVFGKASE